MQRIRYSYSVSGRSAKELSRSIDLMAKLGYDAVELGAELPLEEARETRELIEDAGMAVSSICPSFTSERDLAHPDPRYATTRYATSGNSPTSRALWGHH